MAVKTVNAGRNISQRGNEQNLIANQIYSQDVIKAVYSSWGGPGQAVGVVVGDVANLTQNLVTLAFLQDYPIHHFGITVYGESRVSGSLGNIQFTQSPWLAHTTQEGDPAALSALFTANLASYGARQRAFGTTVTNGLDVAGYMLVYNVAPFGLVGSGGAGIAFTRATLSAIAEGGSVSGNPLQFQGGPGNPSDPPDLDQIILLEADYTQQIIDDDNMITDSTGETFRVVGLFYQTNVG
jgi:hypothetical protein